MRWVLLVAVGLVVGMIAAYSVESRSGRAQLPGTAASRADRAPALAEAGESATRSSPNGSAPQHRFPARTTPALLAGQRRWRDVLNVYWNLPGVAQPSRRERHLRQAFEQAEDPVSRQNLIFLVALTVPWDRAEPWLRIIAREGSDPDREDVLVALAFSGEEEEMAEFRALARAPDPIPARRLVDSLSALGEIAEQGTADSRSFLRSYRAIEVLDRDPYFDRMVLYAQWQWTAHPGDADRVTAALLPAWLDRYPGHPGSDDMAWRLGRRASDHGEWGDALRWLSRGTVLPDQMWTTSIMLDLIRVAEREATPELLDQVANEEGFETANRELLQYIRIRRIAAERSVEEGLRLAEAVARDEPGTVFARAWSQRFAAPPPRGLDSGLQPLPADDPLRAVVVADTALPKAKRLTLYVYLAQDRTDEEQLQPPRNPLPLHGPLLARQFRIWETYAELSRRSRDVDALYKAAAVLYHERDSFYPVYLVHDSHAGGLILRWKREEQPAWARDHIGALRALELFRRIERDFPLYAGMDKVLYSQGLALRRIQDTRELGGVHDWNYEPKQYRIEEARELVAAFERCASRFPRSDLAASASAAARWWRWRINAALER